jgi:hypothetical protein
MKYKEIKTREEAYLQFSDEEMEEYGLNKGDKFTWELQEDGSVFLRKWKKIDIELDEYPKELLLFLIKHSMDNDCTINDTINILLEESLKEDLKED